MTKAVDYVETFDPTSVQRLTSDSFLGVRRGSNYALAALVGLAVGSGGVASPSLWDDWHRTPPQHIAGSAAFDLAVIESPSLLEQLISIRSQLKASITGLARLLNVGRPTIYAWMSGRSAPRLSHIQRISMIYRVGRRLRELIGPNADISGYRFADGSTLIDFLSQETLQQDFALRQLEAIDVSRISAKVPGVSEVRERYGFRQRDAQKRDRALRDATI
jgi:transcriptional regulator with XRE-family HTH domain